MHRRGASLAATTNYGRTPLHAAAGAGARPVAEWLLAQGFGIIKDVISKNMEELLVKDNKELKEKK